MSQCNTNCPGYPDESCGNQDQGLYGYIALSMSPSGTAGGSSSTASSTQSSSSQTPTSTSTTQQQVSHPVFQSLLLSLFSVSASLASRTCPTISSLFIFPVHKKRSPVMPVFCECRLSGINSPHHLPFRRLLHRRAPFFNRLLHQRAHRTLRARMSFTVLYLLLSQSSKVLLSLCHM